MSAEHNNKDPQRIWLAPECETHDPEGRRWDEDGSAWEGECICPDGPHPATEYVRADLAEYEQQVSAQVAKAALEYIFNQQTPRPLAEWHEDIGCVLWWAFPICEPPYVGDPMCSDWIEGPYTHWTPLPSAEAIQRNFDNGREGADKLDEEELSLLAEADIDCELILQREEGREDVRT